MEEKTSRNIFDARFGEKQVDRADDLHASPEAAATKLVEWAYYTEDLTVLIKTTGPGGSWEVLLEGPQVVNAYGEDRHCVYYRVAYSHHAQVVVIEKYRRSLRFLLGEPQAKAILSGRN